MICIYLIDSWFGENTQISFYFFLMFCKCFIFGRLLQSVKKIVENRLLQKFIFRTISAAYFSFLSFFSLPPQIEK